MGHSYKGRSIAPTANSLWAAPILTLNLANDPQITWEQGNPALWIWEQSPDGSTGWTLSGNIPGTARTFTAYNAPQYLRCYAGDTSAWKIGMTSNVVTGTGGQ